MLVAPLGVHSPPLTYKVDKHYQKGTLLHIPLKNKEILGVALQPCAECNIHFTCKQAKESSYIFLTHQKLLAEFIAHYYCCSFSQSYGLFTPLDSLLSKDFESSSKIIAKDTFTKRFLELSHKQQQAFEFIKSTTNPLLFGDTGSGKTEIYIHLIASYLQNGHNALFLMPEIALTPQIEQRLKKVFGSMVGIWHSKVTTKKKQEILLGLQNGTIRIIAGARSALFLPIKNLGLIIVDEEHDDAYKSQSNPRYNARDLALYLGKHTSIKVLLGSATPSLNTYINAQKEKRIFRLKGTHFQTQKSYIFDSKPLFSESMIDSIRATFNAKKQIIVFLPTRAHFKTLLCQKCGYKIECVFCSVSMSLHLDKNALICHYCGYTQAIPTICPNCSNSNLHAQRIGTQEFSKQLQEYFPAMRIGIFDRDHITTHTKLQNMLRDFNECKIDTLVGTQMLSKGHDYHNIGLCVVIGIDYVLGAVDYRANERAMSLLEQIAGRSGRKEDGIVYVQSVYKEFFLPFVRDYEAFLEYEKAHRLRFYPPFVRLANISFIHKQENHCITQMQQVLEILKTYIAQNTSNNLEIVGAKASDIAKLYGKYRYHILLRSNSSHTLLQAIMLAKTRVKFDFEIDIDPLSTI